VICDRPISEVCPVEWARMPGRTVLQWDKDDCADIGLVKFDLLGLGMLSPVHYAVDLVREHENIVVDLVHLDLADPEVYDAGQLLQKVGTVTSESAVAALVLTLVSSGDLDRAEVVARSTSWLDRNGRALARVAMQAQSQRAKQLVIEVVRTTDWTVPLIVPVWHEPAVLEAIKGELDVTRGLA
jgi:hypothetical protein